MPQWFAAIQVHVVFSTQNREPWITPDLALGAMPAALRGDVKERPMPA
jgi:hypothetical protein